MQQVTATEQRIHVIHVGNQEGKTHSSTRKLRGMAQTSAMSDLNRIKLLQTENRRWKIALCCVGILSVAVIAGLAAALINCRNNGA